MGRSRESKSPGTVIGRPPIAKVALLQVAILVLASSGMYFVDPVLSYSLLLGGLVAVVPQAYFAVKVFRYSGARSAREIARSSYVGEVGKFALSVVGFGLIFALVRPLRAEAVLLGFIGLLVLQHALSWKLLGGTGKKRESAEPD